MESEGVGLTVTPTGATVRVELAFALAYTESATEPYRPLGPVTLVLEDVESLALDTPGGPRRPGWRRALGRDRPDEVMRMEWDGEEDVLHLRENGLVLSFRGGRWRWVT
ncbi:hypothetical protein JNUCC64_09620 [Streptomyces sp. JNUCC 64]